METTIDPKTGEKVFASFADGLGSFGNSLFGQYDDGSAMVGTLSDHRARIEAGARGAISDYIDMNWFGETKQEIFDDKVAVLNSQLNTGKVSQDEYNKQAANLSQTYISHDSNYTSDQYETAYDQQLDRYLADEITLEELEQMENNGSIMANYSAPSTMVSDIWDGTVAAGNITTTIVTDGAIGVVDGVTGAIEWAASPDPDGFVVDGEGNQELKFVDVDVDGYVKEITAATHNDGSYSYQVVGEDSVRVYPDGNVIKTNDQGDVTEEYYATTDTTIKYSENRDGNTIETITFSDGSYKEVIYDSYFSQDTTTIYDKAKNSTTTYNADTGVQTEVRKDSYDNITYERIEYNDGGLIDSHSFEEYDRTTGQVRIGDQNGGEIVIQGVTDYDDFDTNLEINADGTPVIPDTYSYKQFNNDEGLIWGEETYVIHDA
ncbi:MAG: hypothetical protein U9Q15_02855, partial [Patescibacteria group bacterium]|nr:hypothetical protein [Patescibacteria group bacterium]